MTRDELSALLIALSKADPVPEGELWVGDGVAVRLDMSDSWVVRFIVPGERVMRWYLDEPLSFQSVIDGWERAIERWKAGDGLPWPR